MDINTKVSLGKQAVEDLELPSTVIINDEDLINQDDELALEEYLGDMLSDKYGFCHNGFKYQVDKDKKIITITDIEWDISD